MFVTIIIPMRDEENYVAGCLDSILAQIEGSDNFEIFCVDGASTDDTRRIALDYARRDKRIHLIDNPQKIVPVSLNLGIKQAKGDVIMRFDTHARYAPDYVDKCLELLERTGADNVGGYLTTVPGKDTRIGRAIAAATSSAFGVGNSMFRLRGPEREVDTVPFGMYRKDVFKRIGLYDERLVRNQDIELNCRLIKAGGRIIISPEIQLTYYNRSTFRGLWQQAFNNGLWNPYTLWLAGGGLNLRHFVPLGFVLSILVLGLAGFAWRPAWLVLTFEILVYCVVGLLESFRLAGKARISSFLVFLAFVQLHLAYGVGSLWGVLTMPFKFGFQHKRQLGQALEYERE